MKQASKKCLAILLTLTLCTGLLGTAVSAAGDEPHLHDENCGYVEAVAGHDCGHTHDGTCGYVEAVTGHDCGHVHDETCGEDGTACSHIHDESCGYVEAVAGQPCGHVHDGTCGYVEAVEGRPCTYTAGEGKEPDEPDALPTPPQTFGITVSNPLGTPFGGREMNDGSGSWYTYCVDPDAVYPNSSNTGYHEIDVGAAFDSQQIAVLERALTAGYPVDGVAAISAIARAAGMTERERAEWTQAAIRGYLKDTGVEPSLEYCYAIYEYAVYGTFQGQPIEPQQVLVLSGVNENGEVELTLDERSGLYAGVVTLSHVAEDLTLTALPGGMTAYVGGLPIAVGDAVTDTVITLTSPSPELRGSLAFSYTAQTSATDLKLFGTDEIASDSSAGLRTYQRMLGYQVVDTTGSTQVVVVALPQEEPPTILPPDTTPEPGPSPEPTPEPTPGPSPEPPAEDIPEEEPPLADLPEPAPSDAPTEGPSPEDVTPEEEIADEEVPMAEAPKTGDSAALWLALSAASGLGLAALALTGRRRGKEDR